MKLTLGAMAWVPELSMVRPLEQASSSSRSTAADTKASSCFFSSAVGREQMT